MIGAKSSRKTEASTAEHFEKTFETIFEQSPISTQIFNAKGETIRVNKAWEKLWGTILSEVKNYNILRDKQLVDEKIMPLSKRHFMEKSSKFRQ